MLKFNENLNSKKWISLFKKEVKNPKSIEIFQEIEIGYNSIVYLIAVNGKQYAVKMYNKRYNGVRVYQKERNHIIRARKNIPDAVPKVIFCSKHTENEFNREILVLEKMKGVPLNKDVFSEQVFDELNNVLKRLHTTRAKKRREITEIERLHNCRKIILHFLKQDEIIAKDRASEHLNALKNFYLENKKIFNLHKSIIHGDLWWDNILVDNEKIKIVDWLESSEQDYCRDLAQLKIGTLNEVLDIKSSKYFFEKLLNVYKKEFEDKTIFQRIRYYLPLMYLEESFYLPFNFFPWEIKYKEAAKNFKRRFTNYFERSEWFFRYEEEI
jgi:Ser/Thr protein kinase RdoA (MazF antagonist)